MNYLDYAVIGGYLLFFLYLGYALRNQKSKQDYFLGGRDFGWFTLTMSTMATQLSAVSFISAPAFVALKQGGGLKWLTYEFAVPLAMIFLMVVLLPPLYRSGVVSIYEFLERRFDKSSRLLLSFIFQVSRGFTTGIMVYALALILEVVLNIEYWQTILVIGVITLIYSLQGGMKAVVYGDTIQMVIIILGIFICLGFGLYHVGGWEVFMANVDTSRTQTVDYGSFGFNGDEFGFLPMIFGGVVLYASYYGCDQTQTQRTLSSHSEATLRTILLANGLLRFPITLAYCTVGLVIGAFAMTNPEFLSMIPADQPDKMMPLFIINYLPHGIIGLLIVAILSAVMSSMSSVINSLSAVTMEDFIMRERELSPKQYVFYSRSVALFWGIVILLSSFFAGDIADTVIEAINKIGSLFYGPILAMFLLAIVFKRVHALAANIGLLAGVAFNIYLWKAQPDIFWFWWNFIGAAITVLVAYTTALLIKREHSDVQLLGPIKIDFKIKETYILLGYFVFIVLVTTLLPRFFQ